MPSTFGFYANTQASPQHGDVYVKGGKAYSVSKDLELVGVRTGKPFGTVDEVAGDWPSAPRILVISDGAAID